MGSMPANINNWEIRADQRYLYQAVVAINGGQCDESFAREKPGPVSTARWLTTASRILRLYMSQQHPDQKLVDCVIFIVKVYAPFWFLIKSQPLAMNGSKHMFMYLTWIRQLSVDIQAMIYQTLNNSRVQKN